MSDERKPCAKCGTYHSHVCLGVSAPMGTNGEAIPLPPLPLRRIFQIADEQDYGEEDRACITRLCRAIEKEAIAPYAERIRHLERELAESSKAGRAYQRKVDEKIIERLERELEQAKAAFQGSENARQGELDAVNRILFGDQATVEAERRARKDATLKCEKCGADRLKEPCGNVQSCGMQGIAYIDGRTAGTAPEGWKLVPVAPNAEMLKAGAESEDKDFGLIIHNVYCAMIAAAPAPLNGKEEAK